MNSGVSPSPRVPPQHSDEIPRGGMQAPGAQLTSFEQCASTEAKYGNAMDLSFSGVVTFAHLPHHKCLEAPDQAFDIALVGMPFDTSVSYRPGARFGPNAIRQGSRRHASNRAFSIPWNSNPFTAGATIVDCGDTPVSPYDPALALDQMETAYSTLLARRVATEFTESACGAGPGDAERQPSLTNV